MKRAPLKPTEEINEAHPKRRKIDNQPIKPTPVLSDTSSDSDSSDSEESLIIEKTYHSIDTVRNLYDDSEVKPINDKLELENTAKNLVGHNLHHLQQEEFLLEKVREKYTYDELKVIKISNHLLDLKVFRSYTCPNSQELLKYTKTNSKKKSTYVLNVQLRCKKRKCKCKQKKRAAVTFGSCFFKDKDYISPLLFPKLLDSFFDETKIQNLINCLEVGKELQKKERKKVKRTLLFFIKCLKTFKEVNLNDFKMYGTIYIGKFKFKKIIYFMLFSRSRNIGNYWTKIVSNKEIESFGGWKKFLKFIITEDRTDESELYVVNSDISFLGDIIELKDHIGIDVVGIENNQELLEIIEKTKKKLKNSRKEMKKIESNTIKEELKKNKNLINYFLFQNFSKCNGFCPVRLFLFIFLKRDKFDFENGVIYQRSLLKVQF